MSESLIIAVLSLIGTAIGAFAGVLKANKLIAYRLEQLETKVNLHNSVIERTFKLEGRMTEAEHDIRDLKTRR